MRKALTPAAAMEAKRLYAMLDEQGRHLYSQMQIADMLGVGETTIFRALHKKSAYAGIRDLPTDAEAEAALQRVLAANPDLAPPGALEKMQSAIEKVKELPGKVEGMLDELRRPIPPNPLEEV